MDKNKEQDGLTELMKLHINLVKTIHVQQRINTTLLMDIWKGVYKNQDSLKRYNELNAMVKDELEAYLFSQHGSIDLKSLFPESDNPSDGLI